MYKFKFADIGEGLHEGVVGEVMFKVGDKVEEGDSLFTVETDKVNSEIPSPVSGKIVKVLVREGETVHVGDDTFHIDDGSSDTSEIEEKSKEEVKVEQPKKEEKTEQFKEEIKVEKLTEENSVSLAQESNTNDNLIKRSTPLARAIAKELGININDVTGSGQGGRILIADVKSFNPGSTIKTSSSKTESNIAIKKSQLDGRREKVKPMRKAIAKAMKNSWSNVAYTNLVNEIDMTRLWKLRAGIKDKILADTGVKVTFLPFIAKAVSLALQDFPILGAKYDEDTEELIYPKEVNLGIAVDTEAGLMVPVIKSATEKNILTLSTEISSLASAARERKIKAIDMQGGTFTITNYGSVGSLFGVPVINYPEIGIAGVGAIIDRPVVKDGQVVPGKIMNLTVAVDHRWIDGATAGRFGYRIKELLENPEMLGVY